MPEWETEADLAQDRSLVRCSVCPNVECRPIRHKARAARGTTCARKVNRGQTGTRPEPCELYMCAAENRVLQNVYARIR